MSQQEQRAYPFSQAMEYEKNLVKGLHLGIRKLSQEAQKTVFREQCLACYTAIMGGVVRTCSCDPATLDVDGFIKAYEPIEKAATAGSAKITRKGNIITYEQKSGFCPCPLIKSEVIDPYPNLCLCTQEVEKRLFEFAHKGSVKVDILESYMKGGDRCLIRIELL